MEYMNKRVHKDKRKDIQNEYKMYKGYVNK